MVLAITACNTEDSAEETQQEESNNNKHEEENNKSQKDNTERIEKINAIVNENIGKLDKGLDKSEKGDKIDKIEGEVSDKGDVIIKLIVSKPFVRPWEDVIKNDMKNGNYFYSGEVLKPLQENGVDGVWVEVVYKGIDMDNVKDGDVLAKVWTK